MENFEKILFNTLLEVMSEVWTTQEDMSKSSENSENNVYIAENDDN